MLNVMMSCEPLPAFCVNEGGLPEGNTKRRIILADPMRTAKRPVNGDTEGRSLQADGNCAYFVIG